MRLKKIFFYAFLTFLTACGSFNPSTSNSTPLLGQTPVYQGMIVESLDSSRMSFGQPFTYNQNQVNINNPFDNPEGQRIEDFINVDLPVDPSFQPFAYYVQPGQEFLIRVQIYNPSQYEILSFTLNGEKYVTYMFEYGSNLQNLILKVNSGSIPGPKNYTIDQIKYVDGEAIRDVIIDGNQTITVGVLYPSMPALSVSNMQFNSTEMSFLTSIVDPYKILSNEYSKVRAYLFDGKSILFKEDITSTTQNIVFSSIKANKLYQYVVVGNFDMMDGQGPRQVYFHNHTFSTSSLFNVINLSPTRTSVSFEINQKIFDKNLLINKFSLIKNGQVIDANDATKFTFDGLYTNNAYSIRIDYSYTLGDLSSVVDDYIVLDFTTLSVPAPIVQITNVNVGKDYLDFLIKGGFGESNGTFKSLKVYSSENVIESFEHINFDLQYKLTGLLSDNNFEIELLYQYDLNDDQGLQSIEKVYSVRTLRHDLPTIDFVSVEVDYDEVQFDYELSDSDETIISLKFEILKNNIVIEEADAEATYFKNLLSNASYTLRATFVYDLRDGKGPQELTKTQEIKTLAKMTPVVSLTDMEISSTAILFEVEIEDPNSTVIDQETTIFRNNQQIDLTEETNVSFLELTPDTQYKVVTKVRFDLKDGLGLQSVSIERQLYTAPFLELKAVDAINTGAIIKGEPLILQIDLNNPSDVRIKKVEVNGVLYNVLNISNFSRVAIQIPIDDEYEGGYTTFIVTKIIGEIRGEERVFFFDKNNSDRVFIHGDVFVIAFNLVDIYGNDIDMVMPGEYFYVKIEFDNPAAYEITSINVTYAGILELKKGHYTLDDDNTVIMARVSSFYVNTTINFSITSFSFELWDKEPNSVPETKSKNVALFSDMVVSVIDKNFRPVSSIQDLLNMRSGFSYRLTKDIDLMDYSWNPINLSYSVFDGSGFVIRNFRTVRSFVDSDVYYGLFGELNETTVKNLTIEDALIVINLKRFNSYGSYRMQVGVLAHTITNSKINNVIIQGQIATSNETTNSGHLNRIGGLAGYISNGKLEQVFVDGFIDAPNAYVGLISGYAQNSMYNRIFTAGKISGTSNLGGLNAEGYRLNINNAYVDLEIMSVINNPTRLGGFFGSLNESKVINSYSNATFVIPNDATYLNHSVTQLPFAGMFFDLYNSQIEDVFSVAKLSDGRVLNPIKNAYSSSFIRFYSPYTENQNAYHTPRDLTSIIQTIRVNWDSKLWNFSGNLPILKWTPLIRFDEVITQETSFTFKLYAAGAGSTGTFTSIKLFKGNSQIDSKPFTRVIEFTDLQYFNTYTIVVEYTVEFNDGNNELLVVTATHDVTTKARAGTPEISFEAIYPTGSGVIFDIKEVDPLNYGYIKEINLYDANFVLIDSLINLTDRAFYGLTSDSNYRMEIVYNYDLLDGLGELSFSVYGSFRTNPLVIINGVSIWEKPEAIMYDDIIILDISIDNVDIVQFNRVMINGRWFNITSANPSRVRVEVNIALFNTIGDYLLRVQELEGIHNGIRYNYRLNANNVINIVINGEIDVSEVSILDQNGDELEYGSLNDSILFEVIFENPTTYDITSVSLYANNNLLVIEVDSSWLSSDKKVLRIPLSINSTNNFIIRIVDFTYENSNVGQKLKIIENKSDNVFVISDKTIRFIRSAQDLQNIQSGFHYQLVNNIDLLGVSWTPINQFSGIIDGNGYTISNLNYQSNIENQNVTFALFNSLTGGNVKNLNLVGFTYLITMNSNTSNSYFGKVGGLAVFASNTTFTNIVVDVDIQLSNNSSIYNDSYVGALVAQSNNSHYQQILTLGSVVGSFKSDGFKEVAGVVARSERDEFLNVYTRAYVAYGVEPEFNSYYRRTGGIFAYGYESVIKHSYSLMITKDFSFVDYGGGLFGYGERIITVNSFNAAKEVSGLPIRKYSQSSYFLYETNTLSLGLESSKEYIISVMQSAWDNNIWSFAKDFPTFKRVPTFSIEQIVSTLSSISFHLNIVDFDRVGSVFKIELYEDKELLQTLTDNTSRVFDNLKYSTQYEIKVIYRYTFDDENGIQYITQYANAATLNKIGTPLVSFSYFVIGDDFIDFGLLVDDPLDLGGLYTIELFDDRGVVLFSLSDFASLTFRFDGLNPEKNYQLRIVYNFNFNEAYGLQKFILTQSFTTLNRLNIPVVEFMNVEIGSDFIRFELEINDPKNVGYISLIQLYDSNNLLIATLSSFEELAFYNLAALTNYRIYVVYSFDFMDEKGLQMTEVWLDFKTTPNLELLNVNIVSQDGTYQYGDQILVQMVIENSLGVLISQVKINGVWYNYTRLTATTGQARVNLNNEFGLGDIEIFVEGFRFTYQNENFENALMVKNTQMIFLNSDIQINHLDVLTAQGVLSYVALRNEWMTIEVQIINPSMLNVISVTYTGTESRTLGQSDIFMAENKQSFTFLVEAGKYYWDQFFQVNITSMSYSGLNLLTRAKTYNGFVAFASLVYDRNPIDISTAQQLQAIGNQPNYHYRLVNSIDLSGFSWTPIDHFYGFLDGNGFTIRNLSIIQNFTNQHPNIGMFRNLQGATIRNISITNATVTGAINSIDGQGFYTRIGILVGQVNGQTKIQNVHISGSITNSNARTSDWYDTKSGLVAGEINNYSLIENVLVEGFINSYITSGYYYAGGITGHSRTYNTFKNILIDVEIINNNESNVYERIGGAFGIIDNSTITKIYSKGMIGNASISTGGIAGLADQLKATEVSSIIQISSEKSTIGGLFGELNNSSVSIATYLGEINSPTGSSIGGIAGVANNSKITQSIFYGKLTGWSRVGGIVGITYNINTIISNVVSKGTIKVGNYAAGGLVGSMNSSILDGGLSQVEIIGIQTQGNGLWRIGGAVGETSNGRINNIISDVKFTNTLYEVGGLVGFASDGQTISNSFVKSTSSLPSTSNWSVGLIVGSASSSLKINNILVISDNSKFYGNQTQLWGEKNVFSSYNNELSAIINEMKKLWSSDVWSLSVMEPSLKFVNSMARVAPAVGISNITTTTSSVGFTLNVMDFEQVGSIQAIELHHEGERVASLQDTRLRTFTGLKYGTKYEIVVKYGYVHQSGILQTIEAKSQATTVQRDHIPNIAFNTVVVNDDYITYTTSITDVESVGKLVAINVYNAQLHLIKTMSGESLLSGIINGLDPLTTYIIEAVYQYNFEDGFGDQTVTTYYQFTTIARENVPSVEFSGLNVGDDGMTFDLLITDIEEVGTITSITLYAADGATVIQSLTNINGHYGFTNLDPSTSYIIKVVYTYNFGDSLGNQSFIVTRSFTTIARENVPSVSVEEVATNDNSISFELLVKDIEEVGTITSIVLYDESNLEVDRISNFEGRYKFEGLNAYSAYKIVVVYTYNFGDSLGNQTYTLTYLFKTTPTVELISYVILNTFSTFQVNDELIISLVLNNPLGVSINRIKVNGVWYQYTVVTDTTGRIRVRLDSSFALGSGQLVFNSVEFIDGNYSGVITLNIGYNFYLNSSIEIEDIRILNSEGLIAYATLRNSTTTIEVQLNNSSLHDVTKVTYSGSLQGTITSGINMSLDKQSFSFVLQVPNYFWNSEFEVHITYLEYSSSTLATRGKQFNSKFDFSILLYNLDVIDISTADELMSIGSRPGYHYRLIQNIDLAGKSWTPISGFQGILDGNGYTISNLSIINTYENSAPPVGLFSDLNNSIIRNLSITKATIIVNYISPNQSIYPVVGTLAGYLGNRNTIENVYILSEVSVDNTSNQWGQTRLGLLAGQTGSFNRIINVRSEGLLNGSSSNGQMFAGGLIGHSYSLNTLNNIFTNVRANVTSSNSYLGGVIGYSEQSKLTNITTLGQLKGLNNVGGIIGVGNSMTINQVVSKSTLTALGGYIGGIAGNLGNSSIYQAYFDGIINASTSDYVGGIIGYASSLQSSSNLVFSGLVIGRNYVGGIFGVLNSSLVSQVNSKGKIEFFSYVAGGVVGIMQTSTLSEVVSTATIKSTAALNQSVNRYGGLVGEASNSVIKDALSASKMLNNRGETAGIIGFSSGSIELNQVIFSGSIEYTQYQFVGLLIGNVNQLTVKNTLAMSQTNLIRLYGSNVNSSNETNNYIANESNLSTYLLLLKPSYEVSKWDFGNGLPVLRFIDSMDKITPALFLTGVEVTLNSIRFNIITIDLESAGSIQSIELLEDGLIVRQLTNLNARIFDNLKYGTEYEIKVKYAYSFDGQTEKFVTTSAMAKTIARVNTPIIEVASFVVKDDYISFIIDVLDTEDVGELYQIRLSSIYGTIIQTFTYDLENITRIDGLDPETKYILEVIYRYDFNEGFGDQYIKYTKEFTTIARENVPSVSVEEVATNDNSISFELLVKDIEEVGTITSIVLYDESNLEVDRISNFEGRYKFEGLNAYSAYKIVVVYTYNFGDSLGNQTYTLTYLFKTTPVLVLDSVELLNSNANSILIKDTILIRFNFDNPFNVNITQVKVNGVWYQYTVTSNTSGRISILATEAIGNGGVILVIEAIRFTIDGSLFNMQQNLSHYVDIFINGEILVNSMEIVDPQFALVYYSLTNQTVTVLIELDNAAMYDVTEVVYSGSISGAITTGITMATDKQSLWFNIQTPNSNNLYVQLVSIKYSNETLSTRTKRFATVFDSLTLVYDENPIDISTIADLVNIVLTKGYTHRLVNDIDLKGVDWQPISYFFGILDGNGFTIKNLSIVTVYEEESPSVGLFEQIDSAYIKNLSITNATIIVTYKSELGNSIYSRVGTLAGVIGSYSRIENVFISSDILVITDSPGSTWENNMVGGLAGYSGNYNTFEQVQMQSVLQLEGKYYLYLGGIIGYQEGNYTSYKDISTAVTGVIKNYINYPSFVGGVVGQSTGQAVTFDQLISGGSLTTTSTDNSIYMGGLVGDLQRGKVINSSSSMNLSNGTIVGGLVGRLHSGLLDNGHFTGTIQNSRYIGGGIVGEATNNSTISYSSFTGVINTLHNNVGGIVGNGNKIIVSHTNSNGKVSGNYHVGGLFGSIQGSIAQLSKNESEVTIINSGAGAISGSSYSTTYDQIIAKGIVSGNSSSQNQHNMSGFVGLGSSNTIQNSIVSVVIKQNGVSTGAFFGDDQSDNKILNSYAQISIEFVNSNTGLVSGATSSSLIVENTFIISTSNLGLYGNRSSVEGAVNVFSTFTTTLEFIYNVINNPLDPLWDNNIWLFDSDYPSLIAFA
jgi:hypothetical protein